MSPTRWTRIDDRLIHGQVVTAWRQHLGYQAISVVDDTMAADPYLSDALRLAVPPGVAVDIWTVRHAVEALSELPAVETLLLLRSPQVALTLIQAGLSLARINVGNLGAQPGSRRVLKSISLTAPQAAALDALAAHGVDITFQVTPDDPPVSWSKIRQRLR
jgi:PTS system mannose-specific IIB component